MTALPEEALITEEEYERLEAQSSTRHEYFQGRVYAMAGGTRAHNEVSHNVSRFLGNRLDGSSCRATGSDQKVKIEETGLHTYPDASVYCKEARFSGETTLLDPILVVEVLSPSTRDYDLLDKFEQYKRIGTLRHILFVYPERATVEHWSRGNSDSPWSMVRHYHKSESVTLTALNIELPLEEIYFGQNVPDGIFLLPRPEEEI